MVENNLLPANSEVTEQKILCELRASFSKSKITADDINKIAVSFQQLLLLRNETIEDYPNIRDYFDYWEQNSYSTKQVIEMIEFAKELKPYGKPLAMGDLVEQFKKRKGENVGIKWFEFETALKKVLAADADLIDKYSMQTVGVPFMKASERKDIKEYLDQVREHTQAEWLTAKNTRRNSIAELLKDADAIHRADKLLLFDKIISLRALLNELESTTRQPLRVLKKLIETKETEYKNYYSSSEPTHTQQLTDALKQAYDMFKGYDLDKKELWLMKVQTWLIDHAVIKPVFDKENSNA